MAQLLPALGLVANLLKAVSFMGTNMPGQQDEGPSVRIKAANPGDDNAEGGVEGNVAEIYAWDVENNYLGKADGDDIGIGDIVDVIVDSSSPGARAEYVGVTMGQDAVCMAWISVTQFDGTPGGAWTGDVGYYCGQDWYHNKETAGYIEDNMEEPYIPRCTWLDEDHSDDIPSSTMKFSVSAYGEHVNETIENAHECDSTIFGTDNAPINDQPAKRMARRARLPWMEKRLIISDLGHTAESLCESETSWGPDFVGEDGMYCDMATHTLHPLCSHRNVEGCVNIDEVQRSVKKRSTVAKRSIETTHKSFESVKRWA